MKTENMKKHTFYTEIKDILGLVMLAVCTALKTHLKNVKESEGNL